MIETVITLGGSILLTLITNFLLYKDRKEKIKAETSKLGAEASGILVGSSLELIARMQETVKLHEKKLINLQEEINNLKDKESDYQQQINFYKQKLKKLEIKNKYLLKNNIGNNNRIKELEILIKELKQKLK